MTTLHRGIAVCIVGALVLSAGTPVAAKPTPAQKCTAAKLKAAAKKLSAKLACYAKAASKNAPVDDGCLGKAETAFRTAFSKAESKGGCITNGDATPVEAAVEAGIEAFIQSLVTALPDGGTKAGGKCAAGKRKAAGKKAMAQLLCYAKTATKNVPVDAACLGKASANLGKAFSKAEKKGGCATTGDTTAVEDAVDAIVGQVVAELTGSVTTTTTVTTSTAGGTTSTGGGTTTTATGPTSTATGPSTTSTTMGSTLHIVMVGPNNMLIFDPATLPIHVGDTVRWVWASSFHSVVSGTVDALGNRMPDGKFCSPNNTACDTLQTSNTDAKYEHTFDTAGNFPYYCAPHGNLGMVGTIEVQP